MMRMAWRITSLWLSVIGNPFLLAGDKAGLDLAKQAESLVGDLLGGRVQVDEDIEVPIGDVGWDGAGTTEALAVVVVGSNPSKSNLFLVKTSANPPANLPSLS